VKVHWSGNLALAACFLIILVFGVYPAPLYRLVQGALAFLGWGG
jgi:hypothetical protein